MSKKLPHNIPKGKKTALSKPQVTNKHSKLTNVDIKDEKPSVSLKYIDLGYNSFEDLRKSHNLKHFDSFLSKLNKSPDWDSVYREFQRADSDDEDSKKKIKSLGYDPVQTEMFHLRVTQKFRVHGFVYEDRFKLVWLDPNHEIHKE
jgi:hypothetical protein